MLKQRVKEKMEESIIKLFKNNNDYCMIFNTILKDKNSLKEIKQIIEIVIKNCLYYVFDYEDMLENLLYEIDNEEFDDYMELRFNDIAKNLNHNSLISLKKNNRFDEEEIVKALNSNPYQNIREIVKHQCFGYLNINANEYDEEMITNIMLDILKNENKNVSDINYDHGSFSNIYFIGDKVLKLGRRNTFRIRNNKRYLKPVIRREHLFDNQKICIELTERVSNDVTYQDLDMIVKELDNQGIEWSDASIDNIGRLIKPNKVYYYRKLYADKGYIETEDAKAVLPAGEIVILDNDSMYEKEKSYVYQK